MMMKTEGARANRPRGDASRPDRAGRLDDRRPWRRVRLPRAKNVIGVDGAILAPRGDVGVAASPRSKPPSRG